MTLHFEFGLVEFGLWILAGTFFTMLGYTIGSLMSSRENPFGGFIGAFVAFGVIVLLAGWSFENGGSHEIETETQTN